MTSEANTVSLPVILSVAKLKLKLKIIYSIKHFYNFTFNLLTGRLTLRLSNRYHGSHPRNTKHDVTIYIRLKVRGPFVQTLCIENDSYMDAI